jgi:Arc/MetJ-type ribon-helix-helix transcriptional regulator
VIIYMIIYMKSMLVELDDDVAARLEAVAPGRTRQRSEFVRQAIRRALWDLEERETAAAYQRQPDSAEPAYFNAGVWEPGPASVPSRRRRR